MTTALITGASRGLGREVSRQLEKRGWQVLRTARKPGAGERALDVTDERSIERLARELEGSRIDVLVNNAGIGLDGFNEDVARRTLETNFFGPLRVTDGLLPHLTDGGSIVMVSSGMGAISIVSDALKKKLLDPELTRDSLVTLMRSFVEDVGRGQHEQAGWPSSAYSVSKVGLNALTRVLARELAPRHIRVNAVCPGWVRTDMGGKGAPRSVEEGASSIVKAAILEQGTGGIYRDGEKIEW